jgi:hypothetical protein
MPFKNPWKSKDYRTDPSGTLGRNSKDEKNIQRPKISGCIDN